MNKSSDKSSVNTDKEKSVCLCACVSDEKTTAHKLVAEKPAEEIVNYPTLHQEQKLHGFEGMLESAVARSP